MGKLATVIPLALAALLLGSACGGGGQPAASPTPGAPSPTVVSQASPTLTPTPVTPTPSARPTPGATVTATATPVATATAASQQAVDAALAAALKVFDGLTDADCLANNPHKKDCVAPRSQPSTVQRGVAVFRVSYPGAPPVFGGVLGRDPAGEWKFWVAGQNYPHMVTLPGDVLVCAEGERLNVRSAPTIHAPVVGKLNHLTTARAEEFVLTEPGSYPRKRGYGWYRLSAPQEGWAYSKYLTGDGSCAFRDALEAP
ncbi:MAG: hypothetical protein ACE5IZ_07670 [Dehalococcoidia bacterium]